MKNFNPVNPVKKISGGFAAVAVPYFDSRMHPSIITLSGQSGRMNCEIHSEKPTVQIPEGQTPESWEEISGQLTKGFSELTTDKQLIDKALGLLRSWLDGSIYERQREAALAHIASGKYALLLDAFYQLVPFGTGGRRGRVGYGPNRINEATVALSVQGHCDYLKKAFPSTPSPLVVAAFDTRIFRDIAGAYEFLGSDHPMLGLTSRELARQACEIYAANGFTVFAPRQESKTSFLATPELSFAIRHLKAVGGVNMSASHNHPDDNGFKFYNHQGAQDIPPEDEYLASFMNDVKEIHRLPFEAGVERGFIRVLPDSVHEAYIQTNLGLQSKGPSSNALIIYTPLSGTGDSTVGDTLRAAGYNIELFNPHANFDGTFSSVPFRLPNPEVREAATPALETAEGKGAWMVLSTDPDADRVGVYARTADGEWRYLTGNEIAMILAYYLTLDKKRGPQKTGLIIKTLVTTRALENIAEKAGCKIVSDLLVGFKYVAWVLGSLEREGRFRGIEARPEDLVIAAEESHGILLTPEIYDKDAAGGALILSELMTQLYQENIGLPEYLDSLSIECGNYANAAASIVMRGIRGTEALKEMMRSLRAEPITSLGEFPVLNVVDYHSTEKFGPLRSETERLSRNLLLFRLDGAQVVVRPSGTEPKVKLYIDVEGSKMVSKDDRRAAENLARKIGGLAFDACIERIGIRLSAAPKLLPDHLDLDLKKDFDETFARDLVDAAPRLAQSSAEERLQWLRKRLSAYGAGADPLEATDRAVARVCRTLKEEMTDETIQKFFIELEDLLIENADTNN